MTTRIGIIMGSQSDWETMRHASETLDELGIRPDGVPEWTANLAFQYTRRLSGNWSGNWELFARADWRYQGDFLINDGGFLFDIDPVNLVNAKLGVENDNWSAAAYVENALDEQFASDPGFIGYFIRTYSRPRSWGVELSYRF